MKVEALVELVMHFVPVFFLPFIVSLSLKFLKYIICGEVSLEDKDQDEDQTADCQWYFDKDGTVKRKS